MTALTLFCIGAALVGQVPAAAKAQAERKEAKAMQEVIAANRVGAKAKRQAPAAPLGPWDPNAPLGSWEVERIKVFQASKGSVVYITSLVKVEDRRTRSEQLIPEGTGTGFVWDNAGHIVTNHHVVEGADEVQVRLVDGQDYKAKVIGRSLAYDTAVLQVFADLSNLKPLPLGRSRELQVGQSVLAIGNPFGLDHSMSQGIVSALDREHATTWGTTVKGAIQTDAAINPGNSGGPLLDSRGRVIGMNTAIASATGASVGIGFAIPVDVLNQVVPDLIVKGKLGRLYLGFEVLPQEEMQGLNLPVGVGIALVDPDSPASKAGLKAWKLDKVNRVVLDPGDVLVSCQGKPLENYRQLHAMLELVKPGEQVVFEVVRMDQELRKVVLVPRAASKSDPQSKPEPKVEPKRPVLQGPTI